MRDNVRRRLVLAAAWAAAAAHVSVARELVVLAPDGQPVAAAVIEATASEGATAGSFVTDAAGRATLPLDHPQRACLRADGYQPRDVDLGAGEAPLVVRLERGGVVHGTVTEPSGRPIAAAAVAVDGTEDATCVPTPAVSGDDGTFHVVGLAPGVATLAFSAGETHLPASFRVAGVRPDRARRIDVELLPTCHGTLAVRAHDGRPLRGARVEVLPEWVRFPPEGHLATAARESIEAFEGETDARGRVALPPLPRRTAYRVAARHDTHAPASVLVDARSSTSTATLRLRRGGRLRLRAVDEEERPWEGVSCRLTPADVADGDLLAESVEAGADGVLRLDHLPAGSYALELRAPGARPRILRRVLVEDGRADDLGDVLLEVGAPLAGTVETEAGEALTGAVVVAETWVGGRRRELTTETDADGAFRFEGLDPETRADVSARADDHLEEHLPRVRAGSEDLVLTLEPAAALEIQAWDGETGEPIETFTATALPEGAERRGARVRATAEAGIAELTGLVPGPYRVRVEAAGYVPWLTEPVEADATGAEPVEVDLFPGRRLEGIARDAADGTPVGGAQVAARLATGGTSWGSTNAEGAFVLEGLEGPLDLWVTSDRHVDWRQTGIDVATVEQPVVVALDRGGSVAGTVWAASGEPLGGAGVSVMSARRSTTSDRDGRYRLDGLAPGRVALQKTDSPDTFAGMEQATVVVRAGEVATQDFGGGARLVGRVTQGGEPAAGARLSLARVLFLGSGQPPSPYDLEGRHAEVDEDGSYAFTGLRAGAHVLTGTWQGRRFSREVDFPPGVGEHREDVRIPDARVVGTVVDADTGEPLANADVSMTTPWEQDSGRSGMMMMMRDETGEEVLLSTDVRVTDTTGPDGRFELIPLEEGTWTVRVHLAGWRLDAQEDLEVEVGAAPVTLVVPMVGENEARAVVRLVSASTGQPLPRGKVTWTTDGRTSTRSAGGAVTFEDLPADEELTFVGLHEGLAPALSVGVVVPAGETVELELALSPGGSLRVLMPADTLQRGEVFGLHGDLHLEHESGLDFLHDAQLNHQSVAGHAEEIAPGEWLFRHLPEGRVVVRRGEGDTARTAEVTILEGTEAEADVR